MSNKKIHNRFSHASIFGLAVFAVGVIFLILGVFFKEKNIVLVSVFFIVIGGGICCFTIRLKSVAYYKIDNEEKSSYGRHD